MKVAKIDLAGRTLDEVFEGIAPEKIACCNWAEEYPYSPEVEFRMFHTGEKLYIRYNVKELHTAARVSENNGEVWTDSCCEFFFSFDGKAYYNVEMNCVGRMLVGFYTEAGVAPIRAGEEILSQVERTPSLGTEPFGVREGENEWSLTMGLPTAIIHQHKVESWDGLKLKVNLYKCGDKQEIPHYLSWQPIDLPQPCFHCPPFFKEIELE